MTGAVNWSITLKLQEGVDRATNRGLTVEVKFSEKKEHKVVHDKRLDEEYVGQDFPSQIWRISHPSYYKCIIAYGTCITEDGLSVMLDGVAHPPNTK